MSEKMSGYVPTPVEAQEYRKGGQEKIKIMDSLQSDLSNYKFNYISGDTKIEDDSFTDFSKLTLDDVFNKKNARTGRSFPYNLSPGTNEEVPDDVVTRKLDKATSKYEKAHDNGKLKAELRQLDKIEELIRNREKVGQFILRAQGLETNAEKIVANYERQMKVDHLAFLKRFVEGINQRLEELRQSVTGDWLTKEEREKYMRAYEYGRNSKKIEIDKLEKELEA